MTPDATQKLWDIEQIKQLKACYFRAMDRKLWDELTDVFTPDAVAGKGDRALHGREAILANIKPILENGKSVHHGHMPEIEVFDNGTARGVWAMYDQYEELTGDPPKGFTGFGHYEETYAFQDGKWRIATMALSRLRLDPHQGGFPDFYGRR
jgi:hypothetical protein